MKPVNAREAEYSAIEIDGMQFAFTEMRIDRSTLPEGVSAYDLRETDGMSFVPCSIEPSVLVNHMGTLLSRDPLPVNDAYGCWTIEPVHPEGSWPGAPEGEGCSKEEERGREDWEEDRNWGFIDGDGLPLTLEQAAAGLQPGRRFSLEEARRA